MQDGRAAGGEAIALLGIRPELADLLAAALSDEAYAPCTLPAEAAVADELMRRQVKLIVLGLGRDPSRLALLDELRVRTETSALPVIVLGTLAPMQEQALASGNVQAVLPMPFDLDDFLAAVAAALDHVPIEARIRARPLETDRALRQAAEVLGRRLRHLMLDWAQQIRTVEPFATRQDLSTREFLDNLPRIINALVLMLRHEITVEELAGDEEIRARIRDHAHVRQEQGLSAEATVHEYQVLRNVILSRLRQELPAQDVLAVVDRVDALLDEAMRITISQYIE